MSKQVAVISPEQAKRLNTPVDNCKHPRGLFGLVLVDRIRLYCVGCGTNFGNVGVADRSQQ